MEAIWVFLFATLGTVGSMSDRVTFVANWVLANPKRWAKSIAKNWQAWLLPLMVALAIVAMFATTSTSVTIVTIGLAGWIMALATGWLLFLSDFEPDLPNRKATIFTVAIPIAIIVLWAVLILAEVVFGGFGPLIIVMPMFGLILVTTTAMLALTTDWKDIVRWTKQVAVRAAIRAHWDEIYYPEDCLECDNMIGCPYLAEVLGK